MNVSAGSDPFCVRTVASSRAIAPVTSDAALTGSQSLVFTNAQLDPPPVVTHPHPDESAPV